MIRKARIKDVKKIQKIVNDFAAQNLMLPRSLNELYENIRDFFVVENKDKIIGCCAYHIVWENLGEIKSLAVKKSHQKTGWGKELVKTCLKEAEKLGIKKTFLLTYIPRFFKKFGFYPIPKSKLPQKIWNECIKCAKFYNCQEQALIHKKTRQLGN
jgi:amino-acid N-acetyltransferase